MSRGLAGLVGAWMLVGAGLARAQATLRWSTVFPHDSVPTPRLAIDMPYIELTIRGVPGDSLRLLASREGESLTPIAVPRRLGRTVWLADPRNSEMLRVEVWVPTRTEIQVRTSNGRTVHVSAVQGPIGIEQSNAAVVLSGILGAVAVTTSNGGIEASFATDRPTAPLSFITSNGPVQLTFPGEPSLALDLETDNGTISSDFPVRPAPDGLRPRAAAGRVTLGRLGGGGILLRVQTDNGDIVLKSTRGPR